MKSTRILRLIFWIVCPALILACGGQEWEPAADSPKTFSFFDVEANTRVDRSIRSHLARKLGNEAVAERNAVSLAINSPDFLKNNLPEVDAFNRRLNSNAGIRVDHNITRLTWRYIPEDSEPFEFAELLFSNYTGKPLLVHIRLRIGQEQAVPDLKKKYGPPRRINWGREIEYSLVWEKHRDVLVFSAVANQFEKPEYEITLYYMNNLEEFLNREQGDHQDNEKDALKNVFSQKDKDL